MSRESSVASWTLLPHPDAECSGQSEAAEGSPPRASTPDSYAAQMILAEGSAGMLQYTPRNAAPLPTPCAPELAAHHPAAPARGSFLRHLLPRTKSLPHISAGLVLVDAATADSAAAPASEVVMALEEERDALAQRLLDTGAYQCRTMNSCHPCYVLFASAADAQLSAAEAAARRADSDAAAQRALVAQLLAVQEAEQQQPASKNCGTATHGCSLRAPTLPKWAWEALLLTAGLAALVLCGVGTIVVAALLAALLLLLAPLALLGAAAGTLTSVCAQWLQALKHKQSSWSRMLFTPAAQEEAQLGTKRPDEPQPRPSRSLLASTHPRVWTCAMLLCALLLAGSATKALRSRRTEAVPPLSNAGAIIHIGSCAANASCQLAVSGCVAEQGSSSSPRQPTLRAPSHAGSMPAHNQPSSLPSSPARFSPPASSLSTPATSAHFSQARLPAVGGQQAAEDPMPSADHLQPLPRPALPALAAIGLAPSQDQAEAPTVSPTVLPSPAAPNPSVSCEVPLTAGTITAPLAALDPALSGMSYNAYAASMQVCSACGCSALAAGLSTAHALPTTPRALQRRTGWKRLLAGLQAASTHRAPSVSATRVGITAAVAPLGSQGATAHGKHSAPAHSIPDSSDPHTPQHLSWAAAGNSSGQPAAGQTNPPWYITQATWIRHKLGLVTLAACIKPFRANSSSPAGRTVQQRAGAASAAAPPSNASSQTGLRWAACLMHPLLCTTTTASSTHTAQQQQQQQQPGAPSAQRVPPNWLAVILRQGLLRQASGSSGTAGQLADTAPREAAQLPDIHPPALSTCTSGSQCPTHTAGQQAALQAEVVVQHALSSTRLPCSKHSKATKPAGVCGGRLGFAP